MSSGGKKKAAGHRPAHQNKVKFYHNPNSKLTTYIYSIKHEGLCYRCDAQIEWRKTYRKYKPLSDPNRCVACLDKTIVRAYHILCDGCARSRGVCCKCMKPCEAATAEKPVLDEEVTHLLTVSSAKERFKRTIARNWERGLILNKDAAFLLREAEEGRMLDWTAYKVDEDAEEDDADLSDDDAADMGVGAKKKPAAAAGAAGAKAKAPAAPVNKLAAAESATRELGATSMAAAIAAAKKKAAEKIAAQQAAAGDAPAAAAPVAIGSGDGAARVERGFAVTRGATAVTGAQIKEPVVLSKYGVAGGKPAGDAKAMERKLAALSMAANQKYDRR